MPDLAAFIGQWRIARRICDERAGADLHFEGLAVFSNDGAGLSYRESGLLYLPGQPPLLAERRYLWRADAQGIAVLFTDGRPFHHITVAGTSQHLCEPDTYQVTYDFARWPVWLSRWTVTGPRKEYMMQSRYEPELPADQSGRA